MLIRRRVTSSFRISMESVSFLLPLAIALDKTLSLAKPLHYSQIVVRKTVNLFVIFSISASSLMAGLAPANADPNCGNGWSSRAFLVVLAVPCGLVLSVSYAYIYVVADRHAKNIKKVESVVRNKELGDSMHHHTQLMHRDQELDEDDLDYEDRSPAPKRRRLATAANTYHKPTKYSYGLAATVTSFYVTRLLPAVVMHYANLSWDESEEGTNGDMCLVRDLAFFLPFVLGCSFDPWIYAFANADLKPLMIGLVRFCCLIGKKSKDSNGTVKNIGRTNARFNRGQDAAFLTVPSPVMDRSRRCSAPATPRAGATAKETVIVSEITEGGNNRTSIYVVSTKRTTTVWLEPRRDGPKVKAKPRNV